MTAFRGSDALGTLYGEDFGRQAPPPAPPSPPPPPPPPAPVPVDRAEIDAACIRAVRAAQDAWSQDAAERRAKALEGLLAGLKEARDAAEQEAELVAESIARVVLGMVAGALPHMCRAHGDEEVRVLMRRLLPLIARSTPVVARVHAGLLDSLRLDLADMDEDILDRVDLRPANLPPGDARLTWEHGSLTRDSAAIAQAMADGLAQLGFSLPAPPPPFEPSTRSLEHVQ